MLHCRILNHEDMGMMAVLDIVAPREDAPGK
ncbi:multicopper oxidase domain-containing protein [Streptomyces sp. NPDC048417]